MIEVKATLRKWGNSFGVVIPKEQALAAGLREDDRVRILVQPARPLLVKDIFGKLRGWKRPTPAIIRDLRKDLDSKFLRA
jgi:hypothetical protein